MWTVVLWILSGFMLITGGTEFPVRGSSDIAPRLRVSPLVIGFTIVAYGTSMPELAVRVQSPSACLNKFFVREKCLPISNSPL
jgi:cation:H+ antiporter